ncbi:MAG: hypothetical protein FWF50_03815 [Defluviitaleaceae bacterium]|nr:hypothetical protein [Defluviitaleaceae bacterium]
MKKKKLASLLSISFVLLLSIIFSSSEQIFSNNSSINYYEERTQRVLEARFKDQFYILDENIRKEYIEKFNQNSEGYVRLFYQQVYDLLTPIDEREAFFFSQLQHNMTLLFPATFENTRKSLLGTIEHHGLNPNSNIDEYLKNSWSKGYTKIIRKDNVPISRTSQEATSNPRVGRIRLEEGTEVKLIDWFLLTMQPTIDYPHFHEKLWEYVEVISGDHIGITGMVPHYYLG